MSESARHLVVERFEGGIFGLSRGNQQRTSGHYHSQLRDEIAATLDAAVDTHASTARRLCFADGRVEKLRHPDAIQHLAHIPRPFFGATAARDKVEHNLCGCASKFVPAPHYYGLLPVQVDSTYERNVPAPEQLSGTNPCNPQHYSLHLGGFA